MPVHEVPAWLDEVIALSGQLAPFHRGGHAAAGGPFPVDRLCAQIEPPGRAAATLGTIRAER